MRNACDNWEKRKNTLENSWGQSLTQKNIVNNGDGQVDLAAREATEIEAATWAAVEVALRATETVDLNRPLVQDQFENAAPSPGWLFGDYARPITTKDFPVWDIHRLQWITLKWSRDCFKPFRIIAYFGANPMKIEILTYLTLIRPWKLSSTMLYHIFYLFKHIPFFNKRWCQVLAANSAD